LVLGSLYEIAKAAVLFLHKISLTAGLVRLRDLTGRRLCSVMRFQRRPVLVLCSFYEIAKVAGFVPSRDFTADWFNSVTKTHGRSAFSGCRLCSVMRFQRWMVLVLVSLYEIAKAAGFIPSRDFTDSRFNSVTRSHGQLAFSDCRVCSVMRFQTR